MGRIPELVAQLEAASAAYYNGEALMSDQDFDMLEAELKALAPDHPYFNTVGAPAEGVWEKVTHTYTMGSLSKAQTLEELRLWFMGLGDVPYVASPKLDGISIALNYSQGTLVSAVTRGDGTVGQDITRNVLKMQGVPKNIVDKDPLTVAGEILISKANFNLHFQGMSNPRNAAAGTALREDGSGCEHLTILVYRILNRKMSKGMSMDILHRMGFKTVPLWFCDQAPMVYAAKLYGDFLQREREAYPFLLDGLVIEVDDPRAQDVLGTTPDGLRPKWAIALKFPHEMATTTLREILWQTGATGRVTPVAVFDCVNLAGAKVIRASLHNRAYIRDLEMGGAPLCVGDQIRVSRRNDVIPAVEARVASAPIGSPLTTDCGRCPECGSRLVQEGAYIVCKNEAECPAQISGSIRRWISKTGTLHFGDMIINAILAAGMVKTLPDIYHLNAEAVAELNAEDGRKIGGSALRAFNSLHANKELDLSTFVGSLGIPMCGRGILRMLVEAGYDDLNKLAMVSEADLVRVAGVGPIRAAWFRRGFDARKEDILGLLAAGVKILPPKKEVTSDRLRGVTVCFTGVRDGALEVAIAAQGGVVKSGVSKGLTYLVCQDPSSTSGKAEKARQLGVQLLSLEQMRSLVA